MPACILVRFDLISSAPCLRTACCFQHTGAILVVLGHASAVLEFLEHASAVLVFWGHTSFRPCQCSAGIFTIIPVNMLDPVWKHFGYGHYGPRAARIGQGRKCWI